MSRRGRSLTAAEAHRLQAQSHADQHVKPAKPNKFHAKAVTVNGVRFGSQREAARAAELQWMEKAGLITELVMDKRRLRWDLIVNGVKVWRYYEADFSYRQGGHLIVEDTKGYRTREYLAKKRLMKALYDIDIRET